MKLTEDSFAKAAEAIKFVESIKKEILARAEIWLIFNQEKDYSYPFADVIFEPEHGWTVWVTDLNDVLNPDSDSWISISYSHPVQQPEAKEFHADRSILTSFDRDPLPFAV